MEDLAEKVKETLNITPTNPLTSSFEKAAVSHPAVTNATWKDTLAGCTTPDNFLLTKTLVFKPKVAKSQTAVLIVVVALEDTTTNGTQIAKAAGEKEARLAAPEAVKEALSVTVEQGIL
jgi:prolyl-tRNA synthetase